MNGIAGNDTAGELSCSAPPIAQPKADPFAHACEAMARRYINENFQPSDWLAVVVRKRETGEIIQCMATAERIASPHFQAWLRYKNAHGSDIFLSLNTFYEEAQGRTKTQLKEIRHLYLDLDQDGPQKLAALQNHPAMPRPNYVLNTSPEKYQVIWKVEGLNRDDAERLLRRLAQQFGGDPAATDSTRVFRLPGFTNKKYERHFQVTVNSDVVVSQVYRASDFRIEAHEPEPYPALPVPPPGRRAPSSQGNSQSEKDWAYALRRLEEGRDPEQIIRDMTRYRSVDHYDQRDPSKLIATRKPNPRYYALRTVTQAMAYLGLTHTRSSGLGR
jgi:hypothetical protein